MDANQVMETLAAADIAYTVEPIPVPCWSGQ